MLEKVFRKHKRPVGGSEASHQTDAEFQVNFEPPNVYWPTSN